MNKNLEAFNAAADKFGESTDRFIGNMIGFPLLAAQIANIAIEIKNNPKVNTKAEIDAYIVNNLSEYSASLKAEDCAGYLFIDDYVDYLKRVGNEH